MNVTRFEPWKLVDLMHSDLGALNSRRFMSAAEEKNENAETSWVPPVDIIEEAERFVLKADVPGVDASAIDINMEDGVLSVSGERQTERVDNADGARRIERNGGKFNRRFTLPKTANAEEISAKSVNGILEVLIPKQQSVKARKITVETA